MADVFISYKRRMRPRVVEIAEALEALGLTVWYDAELVAGRSFGAVINSELSKAACILVCWTPDAFAPEDGSEVSWVEGEATVARDRKVLVPVMLERTVLNAPWNTLHTERLFDWTHEKAADASWLGILAAIGGFVGRPGLAEYVEAHASGDAAALKEWAKKYPDDPLVGRGTRRRAAAAAEGASAEPAASSKSTRVTFLADFLRGLNETTVAARWLLAATLAATVGAALFILRLGTEPVTYLHLAGPIGSSVIFAIALWRSGCLDFGRALFSIFAGGVGWLAAIGAGLLTNPLAAAIGFGGGTTVLFSRGLLVGIAGSFVALAGIALLAGIIRSEFWVRLMVGSIAVGVVTAIANAGLLLWVYDDSTFWFVTVWTLGYGLLMTWLFADRATPAPAARR